MLRNVEVIRDGKTKPKPKSTAPKPAAEQSAKPEPTESKPAE